MKYRKSIHESLALFVFAIILSSTLMSFLIVYFLYQIHLISDIFNNPFLFLGIEFLVANVIGAALAIPLSTKFIQPISNIHKAMKEVGKGNFDVIVPEIEMALTEHNEISDFIKDFNVMVQELKSIELLKNDFINNFSHEFKTPIASIIGFAKELERDDLSEEEKKIYISIILKESKRLSTLSSNILLLSKIENLNIITNKDNYSLDEQIRETILVMQDQWEKKNIAFSLDLEEISFLGNKDLLSQVWINLINNAIKFSKDNGIIEVKLYAQDKEIKVHINDNGIGMNRDTLSHVYNKFYQGDTSHSVVGNGLGLPLVKKIIDLCQGTITIESQENVGTSITVTLPVDVM